MIVPECIQNFECLWIPHIFKFNNKAMVMRTIAELQLSIVIKIDDRIWATDMGFIGVEVLFFVLYVFFFF